MYTKNEHKDIPQRENKLGSDCSGVNGAVNRTLTLAESNVESVTSIIINGAGMHEGAGLDFTFSTNVITFLNQVFDADNISVVYFKK